MGPMGPMGPMGQQQQQGVGGMMPDDMTPIMLPPGMKAGPDADKFIKDQKLIREKEQEARWKMLQQQRIAQRMAQQHQQQMNPGGGGMFESACPPQQQQGNMMHPQQMQQQPQMQNMSPASTASTDVNTAVSIATTASDSGESFIKNLFKNLPISYSNAPTKQVLYLSTSNSFQFDSDYELMLSLHLQAFPAFHLRHPP